MKKILPPFLFALCLLLMAVLHKFLPIVQFVDHPFNLIGVVLFVFGLCMSIIGKRHFSRVGTNIMTFDEPDKLITDGLFRFSRNPMYLGFSIALLGAALFAGSLAMLIIVVMFVVVSDRHYIQYEENVMRNKFGNSYSDYCQSVRRWI